MTLLEGTVIAPPQWDNIPKELQDIPQWCCWNSKVVFDTKKQVNKLTKEPVTVKTDKNLTWRDVNNLSSFEEVKAVYEQGGFNGIGFVLDENTPYVCVDIDDQENVYDMDAKYHNIAAQSYAEVSPSGSGVHVWFKGNKPSWAKTKKNGIEFFGGQGRFVTFTGDIHTDMPINDNQNAIDFIAETFFPEEAAAAKQPPIVDDETLLEKMDKEKSLNRNGEGKSSSKLSDSEVIEKLSQQKPKTFSVYQGDFSNYISQSEAVMALMNDLAFYTAKDTEQMARIFNSSSATYSDEAENARKLSYTIDTAIRDTKNTYEPSVPKLHMRTQEVLEQGFGNVSEQLQLNDNGKIKCTAFNIDLLLNSDIFKGVLAYDMFRQREVIMKDLPWRKRLHPHKKYEQWQPADDAQLRHYLNYNFDLKGKELIMDALTHTFHKNGFHPVKEFIQSVPWDKQPRVETFFIDYLGAEDTPYTRSVARKWFTAAVKRIYEPGCKFDYMPVLVGEQGVGKSTAIQKLAPDFFNDSLRNFDVKESGEVLQTSWLIEIGELAAMKKSEEEEMKGFLSRQVDSFRPAYARTVQDHPRHVVFMGTTNNYEFLKDTTGNRRFLPITVSTKRKYTPWNDLDEMAVAQLWAEAFSYYKQGENVDLDDEIKEVAKMIQANFTERDSNEGIIEDYLNMLLPSNWDNMQPYERLTYFKENHLQNGEQGTIEREAVCVNEVWKECLGSMGSPSRMDSRVIGGILNKLGWKPGISKRFTHYSKQRAFTKE